MVQKSLSPEESEYILEEARYGELESLKSIFSEVDHNLLFTLIDEGSQNTMIHMAAANGHFEVVKFLLSLHKDQKDSTDFKKFLNHQNISGNTALHWASLNGHLEIVKLLCEVYEADPFIKNKVDHDAIFEAENNNKEEVEDYFLKKYSIDPEEDDEFNEGNDTENKEHNSTEPTYTPGTEIEYVTKEAKLAAEQLKKVQEQSEISSKDQDEEKELVTNTSKLDI